MSYENIWILVFILFACFWFMKFLAFIVGGSYTFKDFTQTFTGLIKEIFKPHRKLSRIEYLQSKIKPENLLLIDVDDRSNEYFLNKLLAWQEYHNWVEWEEFYNNWFYCVKCEQYGAGHCICYAR